MTENIKEWLSRYDMIEENGLQDDQNATEEEDEDLGYEEKPKDAKTSIVVDQSRLLAKMSIIPPKNGGAELTEADILSALAEKSIVFGIKTDFVTRLANHPVYKMTFKIAEGQEPVKGEDGYIVCTFNNDDSRVPVENEDGIVDFKNLNFIKNVSKDELLCDVYPPLEGEDGFDIYGHVIEAKSGRAAPDPSGSNTYYSEDKTKLYASCEGNVTYRNHKIAVGRVITVENVDTSTGNLLYVGTIVVKGDVKSGFTVSGSEGIVVNGTVEDATLMSGQNIAIRQGVNGVKSKIIAGGDIRTGFLESTTVQAKGDIYADVILHADIKCEGKVVVIGNRGQIIGGICRAAGSVTAKEIGNHNDVFTEIELFGTGHLIKEIETHQVKMKECKKTIEQLNKTLRGLTENTEIPPEKKAEMMVQTLATKEKAEKDQNALEDKIALVQEKIDNLGSIEVRAKQVMHGNVSLNIEGILFRNEEEKEDCTAYRRQDKVIFKREE